ncbi:MAG: hypothetical protein JRS35_24540 [Deltaproteobacteria bacterium]|nr:hypothetical protein [Deltaproteobacteria bacterium]
MSPDRSKEENTLSKRLGTLGAVLAVVLLAVVLMGPGGMLRAPGKMNVSRADPGRPLVPASEPEPVLLPPPPIDDEYFPCSDCHEDELADPRRRDLDEHDDIQLAHGDLWCLDCHQSDQRDLLHLSDASPVEMTESWRLCTRCHAKRISDWRAGIHGKRTGSWWGPKEFRTCVACHDPHSPLFKPLSPRPPPIPASEIRLRTAGEKKLKDVSNGQG